MQKTFILINFYTASLAHLTTNAHTEGRTLNFICFYIYAVVLLTIIVIFVVVVVTLLCLYSLKENEEQLKSSGNLLSFSFLIYYILYICIIY